MRKNFVFGLLSVVVGAFWTLTGYGQLTTLTEGFDTTGNSVPTPTGIFAQSQPWINVNNSDTPNTTGFNWELGDSGTFIWTAQSPVGSTSSFAQVSFQSSTGTVVSDWLLTPVLTLETGATFSFYTVAVKGTTFANDLQVYISTSGSSTNVGSDAQTPTGGVFTLLPGGDLNPTLAVNGYPLTQPNGWTLETFTLTSSEIGAATTGRIGLRYFIPNTATQGSEIGVDTFSFADPTVFTRTVSGNWTDTTGWTPSGVPNGNTVTAQLVNPGTGTNSVDLGGGTFTLNQLQFSGTNSGTWNVTNGTIIFDGTNPTFLNQGDSSGLVGTLPSLQLNASTTFEIDNASAITEVTGTISGTGGLTKTGSGALVLIGVNTFTGGTIVNAGTLQLGDGIHTASLAGANGSNGFPGGAGTDAVTVNNSATFNVMTNASVSGGAGGVGVGLTHPGNGGEAVSFSAGGSLTNSGTISGGAGGDGAQIANGGNGGAAVSFSAGGSLINSGTISGGAAGAAGPFGGVNGTGGFGVLFSGAAGTLTNLSGGIINGGVMMGNFSNAVTLDIGSVINGILNLGTSTAATLTLDGAGTQLYSTAVTGATTFNGALIKNGTGTWTLDESFTYTGGTTINAGTLNVSADNNLGAASGGLTFDGGTLQWGASFNLSATRAITLEAGNGTFDTNGFNTTIAQGITGSGGLTKAGSGTLTLSGANTYGGATTVDAGTLALGLGGSISSSSELTLAAAGAGFDISAGGNQTIQDLSGVVGSTINLGANTLTAGTANSTSFAGVISGTGALTKQGSGTLTLSGANTYRGATTVDAGTLALGSGGSIALSSGLTLAAAGAGFDISAGGNQTIQDLSGVVGSTINLGANTLTAGTANSTSFAGVISGTGALTKQGSGTLTLSGANTYRGATTVDAGTLALGSGGSIALSSGLALAAAGAGFDISSGGNQTIQDLSGVAGSTINLGANTLTAGTANSTSFAGVISGTGALTKQGSGTLTLSGANTYRGATMVDAGTLALGLGGSIALSSGLTLAASGAGFDISAGGNQTIQDLSGVVGSTINLGANTLTAGTANSTSFAGVISGTGALTKQGSGTLTLSGANTYRGATTVDAGTLALGSGGSIALSSGLTLAAAGAGFDISAGGNQTIQDLSGVVGSTINLGANTLTAGTANSTSFAGVISGTGALTKQGSGTLTLSGANTYRGATTVDAGTLALGSGGSIALSSGLALAAAGAGFDISSGGNQTIQDLSGVAGSTINLGANTLTAGTANSTSFAGVISGTGALTKQGTGTLTLNGNNAYTGGTTVNAGTLQIGNGGTSGSIAGDVSDNATFTFDRSDSITFGGVISGTGALVQMGSGTLTLTADNSYTGGTTINTGASLQLGNGGTTGSIVGNVTDNGSLLFNRSDTVTFNAIISGSGNLAQNGTGTTILGGANTYSGGTIINNGTLLVNNSQALGLGNVVVNGGALGADPQPINVKGNYTQNAGGTLQLQVAGANPGQYDTLNVGGNATLGGTLQLISLGFQPNAGNQLTLVTSGGTVSGQFARFVDPFSVRPGLNTIDLIYGKQSVVLEFLNQTTPVSPVIPTVPTVPTSPSVVPPTVIATINFASFALTPNQLAAANLLDAVQLDPRAANLISFLDKELFANLPSDFEKISPEGLTAFYEISFSNANIQRLTLEGRMDDIHNGSTGFSSNMKVNGATANLENKPGVDGKSSKGVVEPILQPGPANRWGVWVTGFGDFVNVDGDGNANGYNFTTGGFSLGVDYRISDQLAIGAMGEYAHTWTALQPSGDIDVDSGRGGLYATWFNHGIYLKGAIYGGHNTYESSRSSLGGLATGGTEGAEWSTFISGGYDFHFGHLSVGPIAALQYTYVNIDGFAEKSSLAPLAIHSGSAESLRSDFGFRAFYQWQIGKILIEPSLKAAWEHEYKYSALPITAGFAGIPGPSATFFGPNEGHDSAIVSAGVSVQLTPAISTYVNYDGQLGRGNYDSNAVTGGVRISF